MVGAAMWRDDGRRRARATAVHAALAAIVAGCGGGGGDTFQLPAGQEFETQRGAKVLVVVEAVNECGRTGTCVPAVGGPCTLGDGNARGLALYRLGPNGLLFRDAADPAAPVQPEQVIPADDNPRRLLVHPRDPRLVYVATNERIQLIRLAPDGQSRCIDETLAERDVIPDAEDLDPIALAIDPDVGDGILYVASSGANRIDAYALDAGGGLPDVPTSCIVGSDFADFAAVTPVGPDFLATGGRRRVEIYRRADGLFPTATPTPEPEATPTATPAEEPTPAPSPTCIGAREITPPVFSLGAALVTDLVFLPSVATPLGELLVAEEVSRRMFIFPVDPEGAIAENDTSRTGRVGVFQRILRQQRAGATLLYVSVFNEGRVDVFQLEEGRLPRSGFSRTAQDPFTLPVGLATDGPAGPVLYVAQGGVGRVDGFRLLGDGGVESLPATSTSPLLGPAGARVDTFPNDVAIVPLP
jgi:hypothetical protein